MKTLFTIKFHAPSELNDSDIINALKNTSADLYSLEIDRVNKYPYTYFHLHDSRINGFQLGWDTSLIQLLRYKTGCTKPPKPIGEVTIPGQREEFLGYQLTFSLYDCDGTVIGICEGDYT